MHTSHLLTEMVVVREWLHDTAPRPPPLDATTGYWRFTKHQTMQTLRTGKANALKGLDPDAVNRGEGGVLAPDDAVSSKLCLTSLSHTVPDLRESIGICTVCTCKSRQA